MVEGQVGEVLGEPPAYAQPLTQIADDPGAGAVVADEQDSPSLGLRSGLRLSQVVEQRGEAERAAPSRARRRAARRARRPTCSASPPSSSSRSASKAVSRARAPRGCGRGHRGGGTGSARRREVPRARAAPRRRAKLVQEIETPHRIGAGEQQAQLRELALARLLPRAPRAAARASSTVPGSIFKLSVGGDPRGAKDPDRIVHEAPLGHGPQHSDARGRWRPPCGSTSGASSGRAGPRSR